MPNTALHKLLAVATLLCGLVLPSSLAIDVAALGTGQAVTGGQITTLTYLDALLVKLEIETDFDATVTLSANATLDVNIPQDYSSIGFSTGIGYHLHVSGNASVVTAKLTTAALSASALALLSGSLDARCMRFDSTAQAYSDIAVEQITLLNQLVVSLPTTGFYVFGAADVSVPLPRVAVLGAAVEVDSASGARVTYADAPGLELVIRVDATANVTLDSATSLTVAAPDDYSAINFGANAGFNLTVDNGAGIVEAHLTTPSLSAEALALITGSVETRAFRFDTEAQAYTDVAIEEMTLQNQLVVDMPEVGFYAFAAVDISVPIPRVILLGTQVEVNKTSGARIAFTDAPGLELVIRVDATANVTLDSATSLTVEAPDDYSAINFGANAGFNLTVDNGAGIVEAHLTTPSLSAEALALITGSVETRAFRFDAEAQAYTDVAIEEMTLQNQLVVDMPEVGFYAFAAVDISVPIPRVILLGAQVEVDQSSGARIAFTDAPGLELVIRVDATANVTLDSATSLTVAAPVDYSAINFGANAGFNLTVDNGAGIVEAHLTTPSLSAEALALITGSVETRAFRFDTEAQAYTDVAIEEMTLQNQLVVDMPEVGFYAFAAVDISVPIPRVILLGAQVEVDQSSGARIAFTDAPGLELVIRVDATANVTLDSATSLTVEAPDDYSAINFGANAGFNLTVDNGAGIVEAHLTTPSLSAEALALITGSVETRAFRFDTEAQAYTDVAIEEMTLQNQLVVDMPEVGFYAFAAVDISVPIPRVILLGAQVEVDQASGARIAFTDAPGLELVIRVDATANVALDSATSLTVAAPDDYSAINFGANAGFNLTVDNGAGIVEAHLTTPSLSAEALALITGSVETRAFRFDTEAQAYTDVAIEEMTLQNQLVVNMPEVGLYAFAAVDISVPIPRVILLGAQVEVDQASGARIAFTDAPGLELVIRVDATANVALDSATSLTVAAPDDYSAINFGANAGFNLTVDNGAGIVEAHLTTPSLSAEALALITGSVETRAFRFDTEAQAYTDVAIEEMTLQNQLVVDMPEVGLYAFAAVDISVPVSRVVVLGAAVQVNKTSGARIAFSDAPGLELVVSVDATANVRLASAISLSVAPAADYSVITFGASSGFNLTVDNGARLVQARLTTPTLSAEAQAEIAGSGKASCLRFDTSAQAYANVALNSSQTRLVVDLPSPGLYVFASADVTAPVPVLYSEAQSTSSSQSRLSYPGGFFLQVATASENQVSVDFSATSDNPDPENATSMGAFFTIDLASDEEVEATLEYEFDSSVAADVAARLRFAFWDTTAAAWTFLDTGAFIDVDARIVSQATTHFSTWGVFDDNRGTSSSASASKQTTLGTAVALSANVATRVTFTDGPGLELLIKADRATSVTFDTQASVSAGLLSGYNTFSIGGNLGFSLALTGNAVIVDAQLTTPSLSLGVLALLTGSVDARCARFDADAQAWTGVEVESRTLSNKLVVDLPKPGTYVFASVDASVPIPTLYVEARATSSTRSKFAYDGGFFLDVATTTNNEVTVSFAETSSRSDPEDATSVGAFFNVDLRDEEQVDATLSFEYDASLDADIASSLRFAFYDDDEDAWTFMESGANVDTSARVVSQTTTHFSEWGVFATGDATITDSAIGAGLQLAAVFAAVWGLFL